MRIQCQNCFKYYANEAEPCPCCGYMKGEDTREAPYMKLGSVLRNRYRIGRILNRSDHDVIYLAWDTIQETRVAVREYLPKAFASHSADTMEVAIFDGSGQEQFKEGLESFIAETKLLEEYQYEQGIVRIFESFMENNTAYIIMEYLEGVTLVQYVEHEETPKAQYALPLLTAIVRLLEVICSGDVPQWNIAPENIMITKSGQVKLFKL